MLDDVVALYIIPNASGLLVSFLSLQIESCEKPFKSATILLVAGGVLPRLHTVRRLPLFHSLWSLVHRERGNHRCCLEARLGQELL